MALAQVKAAANNALAFWCDCPDGPVYAEPLYAHIIIPGAQGGIHAAAFVATEHDSVYAIDVNTREQIWRRSFLEDALGNPLPGVTTVPPGQDDAHDGNFTSDIGITGTPVIDGSTGRLYVVAKTKEVRSGVNHYVQTLHALDTTNGADVTTPYVIGDTTIGGIDDGYTDVTSVVTNVLPNLTHNVPGSDGMGHVKFNALRQLQRAGLTLTHGTVYVAFGAHADTDPYHGWVLGFDADTLELKAVFNDTPNGFSGGGNIRAGGGIWQSGGKLAADTHGNLYLQTGNGTKDDNGDYGDSFLKLAAVPRDDPQYNNRNGWGLKVAGAFTPDNFEELSNNDWDLGSGGPILLPDEAGSDAHRHLLAGAGKEGRIYLIDRDTMELVQQSDRAVIGPSQPTADTGAFDTPAYFRDALSNDYVYFGAAGDQVKAFKITQARFDFTPSFRSFDTYGTGGTTPTVSSRGADNGIVWTVDYMRRELRAYRATNPPGGGDVFEELFNSGAGLDQLDDPTKFSVPTVADGKVLVGTSSGLVIFGLDPVLAPVPDQKVLPGQQTRDVPLSVTHPGGGTLTFSATGQSLAYVLTQQTGTLTYVSRWDNSGGRNEKWLQAPSGQWYFILPTGELDRWDGNTGANGTALGIVGASYHSDPTLLTNPPANEPHATFSFTGNTLTITRDLAWISGIVITVTVSNDQGSDSKTFDVFVGP